MRLSVGLLRHAALLWCCAACKGPAHPHEPIAGDLTLEVGRDGASLRGIAGDGQTTYAAFSGNAEVEARNASGPVWRTKLAGTPGELEIAGNLVVAAIAASGSLEDIPLRGQPSAMLVALDRAKGAQRWRLIVDASEWSIISSLTPLGNDTLVGGTFAGSLRAGPHVVTSAGGSDGFVARVTAAGQVAWLVRMGGSGADGIQGIATQGERIAIAGTFTAGADLLGATLTPYDDSSPFGDVFIAELDGNGARKWQTTFGGRGDESVAGVTIDRAGQIVVAANAREVVNVGGAMLVTQGPSDGVVVFLGEGGEKGPAVLVGGLDFDGLRAITSVGDSIVVGGFFSGQMKLGDRTLTAGGGDDAFVAALDGSGTITTAWHVGGPGREEITALSAIPGGFIAGVSHTAAADLDGAAVAAPKDPMTGAALMVRGF